MKVIYKIQVLILTGLMLITGSCKDFVDINDDPNNPTTAVLELLLPATQVSMAASMKDINQGASILVQQLYTGNTSRNFQDGTFYQQSWNGLYTQVLNDLEIVIKEGTTQQRWGFVTIAKLQKAYIYSIMVDMWGDIPYSESSQASAIENPAFESGADIYDKLFILIDEAIADADRGTFSILPVSADIIYRGSKDNWIRMANSLKLKLFNQIRLVDAGRAKAGIDGLLASGAPLISANTQDFSFRFGATETPANRHPWHRDEYQATKVFYMSQGFMLRLLDTDDPRLRYYFFRQNATATVGNANNGNGYFGRFTGDPTGVPNDNARRTTFGVYPAGGLYDNGEINNIPATHVFVSNSGTSKVPGPNSFITVLNTNGSGAGLLPFITNAMVKFIQAEAALTLGTAGDPKQLLQEAINANLTSINTIATSSGNAAPTLSPTLVSDFAAKIASDYDAAADDTGRLDIVLTQKYISQFGNGMESYNDYRRTGFPVLPAPQAPLNTFPLRLAYSITELSTNETVLARENFMKAYEQIRQNFIKVFRSLFSEEDSCDLKLSDPANPLESSIEIMAKPKGKRPLTINQLSGGEKTLTAISLLFAIYLLKPAPFCIFDEVDAPLDDANIDKFNNIIRTFSADSQFIVVTHNKRTMVATDIIYGITQTEDDIGVSKVVPVDLRALA